MGRPKLNIFEDERKFKLNKQRKKANLKASLKRKKLKQRCVKHFPLKKIENE